jgi:hypothetical protein
VRKESCEIVICGVCGVKASMTTRPRASEAMKLGSPVYWSSATPGRTLAFGVGTGLRVEAASGAATCDTKSLQKLLNKIKHNYP